ncbi:MAG TPA: hypothetical protein VHR84_01910 [Terriglobales bacterium]|jgi:hypothetical protein|nr:hypothetical protein [Terriglobales bacterium]
MITVKVDVSNAIRSLDLFQRRQVPYAASVAINRTARQVEAKLKQEMMRVFDRPTPFTLSSIYVIPSTKYNLTAVVGIKDSAAKGTPASKYLITEIEGGIRRQKRSEKALEFRGLMPAGMYAVPGPGVAFDAYGNISRGTMTAILNALRANVLDPTQQAPLGRKTRGRPRLKMAGTLFVATKTNPKTAHVAPGVWKRTGPKSMVLLLAFVPAPHYAPRFKFENVGRAEVERTFEENFNAALRQAMATAR